VLAFIASPRHGKEAVTMSTKDRDHVLIAVAALAVCVHLIDSVVSEPRSGWAFDIALLLGFLTAGFAGAYPRINRPFSNMPTAGLGLIWALGGLMNHMVPMMAEGPSRTDYSGAALTAGGVVMIWIGARDVVHRLRGIRWTSKWPSLTESLSLLLLLVSVAVAACGDGDISTNESTNKAESPQLEKATLVASGSALEFVPTLRSEPVKITLQNEGRRPTRVLFARLNDGVTLEEFEAALKKGFEAFFPLITPAGSTVRAEPGAQTSVTITFPEGRYAVAAEPFAKIRPAAFDVEGGGAIGASPEADYRVEEGEYFIKMPDQLAAGRVTLAISNVGGLGHELILFRDDDKREIGTIAPAPGGKLWATFKLRPGRYTAVCYIPDLQTGKPHANLGMKTEFVVE